MKLKLIVAAVAVLASAQSFALKLATDAPVTEGSSLFLNVADEATTQQSYTLDLGIKLAAFEALPTTPGYTQSWTLSGANWSAFLGSVNPADIVWSVEGNKKISAGNAGIATTLNMGNTQADLAAVTNLQLQNASASLTTFVGQVNNNLDAAGTSSLAGSTNPAYWGYDTKDNIKNLPSAISVVNALGAESNVYFDAVVPTVVGGNIVKSATLTAVSAYAGTFKLAQSATGDYQLTYSVAAVPEPSTYALLLAGMSAVGLVARRRAAK